MFLMTLKTEIASEPDAHMPPSLCSVAGLEGEALERVALGTALHPILRDSLVEWTLESGCPGPPNSGFCSH